MKKNLFLALVFLGLLVIIARLSFKPLVETFGIPAKAGIKITSNPESMVSIEDQELGKTPFDNQNLKDGEYLIKLSSKDSSWQDRVKLTKGTLTVVNRELAPSLASSSGEVLTLHPGRGVVITSTPGASEVEIDNKPVGKTPLSVYDLEPGEHTFLVSHNNYTKRSIRAALPPGLSLYIDVDLAVLEADLGSLAAPALTQTVTLSVKQTPLGFLRVRNKPSLQGAEVARVSIGEVLTQIEELSGWVKVRLNSGVEGYVSSQYVQKQL